MGKEVSTKTKSPVGQYSLGTPNPWAALPSSAPYILLNDFDNLRVLPVPYLGDPERARLFVLQLNPGFQVTDVDLMQDSYYVEQNRKSLTFEANVPFWVLDDRLAETPGHRYWKSKFRWLAAELGDQFVKENVVCVEFFPYHSKEFYGPREPVPSQDFAFRMVRDAIQRELPVVIMRAREMWESAVPTLVGYKNRYELHGRNAAISPGNMGTDRFAALIAHIRGAQLAGQT